MKPNLLFRIDGIILLVNGVMAAFLTELFVEGAGMGFDADVLTTGQAFGAALITIGITVFRVPSFVGKMKEAITTVILGHLTFVILIGFHLITSQAEGPNPIINLALNLIFITLYLIERKKV